MQKAKVLDTVLLKKKTHSRYVQLNVTLAL